MRRAVASAALVGVALACFAYAWAAWPHDLALGPARAVPIEGVHAHSLAADGRHLVFLEVLAGKDCYDLGVEGHVDPRLCVHEQRTVAFDVETGERRVWTLGAMVDLVGEGTMVAGSRVFDLSTGEVRDVPWPDDFRADVRHGPLFYGPWNDSVAVADLRDGSLRPVARLERGPVAVAAAGPSFVVLDDREGGLTHVDLATGARRPVLADGERVGGAVVLRATVATDGDALVVAGVRSDLRGTFVRVLDARALEPRAEFELPEGAPFRLSLAEGRWVLWHLTGIAYGDAAGTGMVWVENELVPPRTQEPTLTPEEGRSRYREAVASGRHVAYVDGDGKVWLADPAARPVETYVAAGAGATVLLAGIVGLARRPAPGGKDACPACGRRGTGALPFCAFCGAERP